MNLLWGVTPVICDHTPVTDDMVRGAERLLWQRGVVHNGDVIGIVAGTRTSSGSTNFLRLHVVGSMDFAMDGVGERRCRQHGGQTKRFWQDRLFHGLVSLALLSLQFQQI